MLGLDTYGSDSEGSGAEEPQVKQAIAKKPVEVAKPKPKKKITIGLSSLPKPQDEDETSDNDAPPATKKRKLESGAGASGLMSMLPAPKKKGFALPPPTKSTQPKAPDNPYTSLPAPTEEEEDLEPTKSAPAFISTSVRRGQPNPSLEESKPKPAAPAVDFFGLSTPTTSLPKPSTSSIKPAVPDVSTISSAPTFTEFEPPEPTPTDPYPGYYQLPSGTWAAYDQEYYRKFMKKWQAAYDAHVRALEKGTAKGFEEMDSTVVHEVDAQAEMERAKIEIKDREEKKALTQGAASGPAQPNMKITAAKMSGVARSRHQLSTLLREAYENREALEERIAQGKRNRKEAGNKYGF